MGRVAALGCILCDHLGLGATPAQVHHIREGQGASQRASNFLTVPLCPEHHQGNTGLHGLGTSAFERTYRLSELDLLAMTIERLGPDAGKCRRHREVHRLRPLPDEGCRADGPLGLRPLRHEPQHVVLPVVGVSPPVRAVPHGRREDPGRAPLWLEKRGEAA